MEASKDTYKSNVKLLFKYLAKGGGEIVYNGLNIEISNSIAVMIRLDNPSRVSTMVNSIGSGFEYLTYKWCSKNHAIDELHRIWGYVIY